MGFLGDLLGTNSKYRADESFMDPYTRASGDNNLQLQQMLMDQAQGGGPNLADQMNKLAVQRNQAAAASTLGSMKGISPAAMTRAISQAQTQAGAEAAGQATLARMQQQLEAQRLLGVNSMGMTGIGAGYRQGADSTNAQTASQNAKNSAGLIGGLIGGAGAAMGMPSLGGGKWAGGPIEASGPQSWLGQAAVQMQGGGMVPGRAAFAGDSPTNDTVPAALSPGEIVLPRSVAQHPDAARAAYDFVAALKARGGR